MLNNWQNRTSIRKDILACCAQRHSLFGRSVNLLGPLCVDEAQLPPTRYQKATPIAACLTYFMQLFAGSESRNCFCPRNLTSRNHSTKSQGCSCSRRNVSREKRTATSKSKLQSIDDYKRYVIVVNEDSQEDPECRSNV